MNIYEAMLKGAIAVREGKKNPQEGICWHLNQQILSVVPDRNWREYTNALNECFKTWPENENRIIWPISTTTCLSPADEYSQAKLTGKMWEGHYGETRLRLLDHIIQWSGAKHAEYLKETNE